MFINVRSLHQQQRRFTKCTVCVHIKEELGKGNKERSQCHEKNSFDTSIVSEKDQYFFFKYQQPRRSVQYRGNNEWEVRVLLTSIHFKMTGVEEPKRLHQRFSGRNTRDKTLEKYIDFFVSDCQSSIVHVHVPPLAYF